MIDWVAMIRATLAAGPTALVSVLATEGSAPRGAGTRMAIGPATLHGTIGGGQLEYRAIDQARAILAHPPGTWRVQDYPLGPLLGQCCGGRVRLLIEHLDPTSTIWLNQARTGATLTTRLHADHIERAITTMAPIVVSARGDTPAAGAVLHERLDGHRRPLYLFGAGHVGRAIATRAIGLPFTLAWFDTRPLDIAGVTIVDEDMVETCVGTAPAEAALLIVTHDHALDYRLARAALCRPLAFTGMIGSATKRARFLSRLTNDGIDADARLVCPIGLPGIVGKEPDVIATATLAQLLTLTAPR